MSKSSILTRGLLLIAAVSFLMACSDNNSTGPDDDNTTNAVEISGDITENTTWMADEDYLLIGQTFVKDGATLTIEAGTTIKSKSDDGNGLAPALVIERGAKIIADGTADNPITFTSDLPG